MSRLVFLVEERSMAAFLETWLPRAFPDLRFTCIPHEGKKDLRKSIPRKLKAWQLPEDRFVVVVDNDNRYCEDLKADIVAQCLTAGRGNVLVRLACQELEAWYLGDPEAMAAAFKDDTLPKALRKARFRKPDSIAKPSKEITKLVPQFQKVSGARAIAAHIDRRRNKSPSFRAFATGIDRVVGCDISSQSEQP